MSSCNKNKNPHLHPPSPIPSPDPGNPLYHGSSYPPHSHVSHPPLGTQLHRGPGRPKRPPSHHSPPPLGTQTRSSTRTRRPPSQYSPPLQTQTRSGPGRPRCPPSQNSPTPLNVQPCRSPSRPRQNRTSQPLKTQHLPPGSIYLNSSSFLLPCLSPYPSRSAFSPNTYYPQAARVYPDSQAGERKGHKDSEEKDYNESQDREESLADGYISTEDTIGCYDDQNNNAADDDDDDYINENSDINDQDYTGEVQSNGKLQGEKEEEKEGSVEEEEEKEEEEKEEEEEEDDDVDDDDDEVKELDDRDKEQEDEDEDQVENDDDDDDDDDDVDEDNRDLNITSVAAGYLSKDGKLQWYPRPCSQQQMQQLQKLKQQQQQQQRLQNLNPTIQRVDTLLPLHSSSSADSAVPGPQSHGPTQLALSLGAGKDILSTFLVFYSTKVERLVLQATKIGVEQKAAAIPENPPVAPDQEELRAFLGLLLLAGVYRSRGESAASLWDSESGRAIFPATMPLKRFYALSMLVRFDDRSTRAERREQDKLAAFRELWDAWSALLPAMYVPGPEVTVDERLVPFRGRCPFRQYIPSKPGKYGIKLWVACDSKSSYAWRMSVYTGKQSGALGPEKHLGMQVVLDVTRGLGNRNVTCDNFFTSHKLAEHLLLRPSSSSSSSLAQNNGPLTLVGTVRKNKPELPPALACISTKDRAALSTVCAYTPCAALVSYVPKKGKNVLLLSTLHREGVEISENRADQKPLVMLHYNANKGGVDNLDKLLAAYSCRRMTRRWTAALFHNVLDVSAYNAFVLWRETNPEWMPNVRHNRRLFLEQLGRGLVAAHLERRAHMPRGHFPAKLVRDAQARVAHRNQTRQKHVSAHVASPTRGSIEGAGNDLDDDDDDGGGGDDEDDEDYDSGKQNTRKKRKRCYLCPRKKDRKTSSLCCMCRRYVCGSCAPPCCRVCRRLLREEASTAATVEVTSDESP